MYQDQGAPLSAGGEPRHDIEFEGRMGSFIGLAAVNLLLTIVTIGIYRFWAKTQVRRYLWGNTRFAGETLEYRGRGVELLVGALLTFVAIIVPLFLISLVIAMLDAQGLTAVGRLLQSLVGFAFLYLVGVGLYRSQRYLLSRTSWCGIRGGMVRGGWAYGTLYLRLSLLQVVTLGLATPYVSTRLWNARMNDAMLGSMSFHANATWRPLFGRFIIALAGVAIVTGIAIALAWDTIKALQNPGTPAEMLTLTGRFYAILLPAMLVNAFITLSYRAHFWQHVFASTGLDTLGFGFGARTMDWLRYYLGNALIVALTFGLGVIVLPYRIWSFYARNLVTVGALEAGALEQTRLAAPTQGDGIADAFDMTAF